MSFVLAFTLLAAARVLSPERPLTTAPVIENRYAGLMPMMHPGIASDGTTTFAIWSDYRSGWEIDVFAARLDDAGRPVDAHEIPIATRQDMAKYAQSIVWDGRRFLVVWVDFDRGTMIAELRPDGSVVNATSVSPLRFGNAVTRPDGGVILSASGAILIVSPDFQQVTMRTLDPFQGPPHIARIRDGYIAIWDRGRDVMTQQLDVNGEPAGTPARLAANNATTIAAAAASRGDDALIAYSASGRVNVFTVSPAGAIAPLVSDDLTRCGSMIATAGGGFVIADEGTSELRRYDAHGTPVDRMTLDHVTDIALTNTPRGVAAVGLQQFHFVRSFVYGAAQTNPISFVPQIQTEARLATDGTNTFAVWSEGDPVFNSTPLFATLAGSPAPPVHIDDDVNLHAAGFDGTAYFAIWTTPQLRMQRFDRSGRPLKDADYVANGVVARALAVGGPYAAWIGENGRLSWMSLPDRIIHNSNVLAFDVAAAWDGTSLMFAIRNGNDLLSLVPGGSPVRIDAAGNSNVAIAGDGRRWFVVYEGETGLYGRFLTHDGSPDGAPVLISTAKNAQALRTAWDGEAFVITWDVSRDVYVARILGETQPLSVTPLDDRNCDLVVINGNTVVAYQRAAPEANYVSRIQLRTLVRPRTRAVR